VNATGPHDLTKAAGRELGGLVIPIARAAGAQDRSVASLSRGAKVPLFDEQKLGAGVHLPGTRYQPVDPVRSSVTVRRTPVPPQNV
jgi:hypothetical protein